MSGVAVNSALQPVIFHRSDRVWDQTYVESQFPNLLRNLNRNHYFSSFNNTHHYQQSYLPPIKEHTVLTLDSQTGKVLWRWGADMFWLPHGLTIDRHDNLWLTDVALHQVFKVNTPISVLDVR